jgi:pimeloyl-ACP methyl ester carboxylesterase
VRARRSSWCTAFTDRTHPTLAAVAAALAPWFTVFNYDRRGRGDSGDNPSYAVARELEDLAAVITATGGTALVFGGSSGAALALRAAAHSPAIVKLAVWEPPFHVDSSAPYLPDDFAARLAELVEQGRRADAVELFMVAAAEIPAATVGAKVKDFELQTPVRLRRAVRDLAAHLPTTKPGQSCLQLMRAEFF